jgi:nicotinic acid mononucleotide adenylyltransferase
MKDGTIRLRHGAVHILTNVDAPVASRDIRHAVRVRKSIAGLVPEFVEEYIEKAGLYISDTGRKKFHR